MVKIPNNTKNDVIKIKLPHEELQKALQSISPSSELLKISEMEMQRLVNSVGETYKTLFQVLLPSIQESHKNLINSITPIFKSINQNVLEVLKPFSQTIKISELFNSTYANEISSLSLELSEFTKGIVSDKLAQNPFQILEESQSEKAIKYAHDELKFITEAEWVMGIRRIIRNGLNNNLPKRTIVHQLITLSRSDDFIKIIEGSLLEIPEIRKRKHLIMEAVKAHTERRYYLSIPIFLIQIEGMITDCLLARRIAIRGKVDRNKIHIRKNNNMRGNELEGLVNKVNRLAKGHGASILQKKSRIHVADDISKFRNSILHGYSCTYGKPLVSLQMLMLCLGLLCIFDSVKKHA